MPAYSPCEEGVQVVAYRGVLKEVKKVIAMSDMYIIEEDISMSIELDVEVGMDMVWVAVVICDMSIMASSIVS